MRPLCSALLIFHALLVPAQQPDAPGSNFSGVSNPGAVGAHRAGRQGPSRRSSGIQDDLSRPGGKGLVMPADAHLYGRVVSVGQKQDNKNSYLAVVVVRAEWKGAYPALARFRRRTDHCDDEDAGDGRRQYTAGSAFSSQGRTHKWARCRWERSQSPWANQDPTGRRRHTRSSVRHEVPGAGERRVLPRQGRHHLSAVVQGEREIAGGRVAHAAKRAWRGRGHSQCQARYQHHRSTVAGYGFFAAAGLAIGFSACSGGISFPSALT